MTGPIALVGSGEFEPWAEPLDRALLERATGDGSVLIVPTASAREGEVFDGWAAKGLEHYAQLGVVARWAAVRDRGHAFRDDFQVDLARATLIYFSGGDPAFLCRTLRGTPFWAAVLEASERGAAVAGCSAGACMLGEFAPPTVSEPVEKERWEAGLHLVENVWVLPHWDALRQEVRQHFLGTLPETAFALGIEERTAAVWNGELFEVFGEGSVVVPNDGEPVEFVPGESFGLEAWRRLRVA